MSEQENAHAADHHAHHIVSWKLYAVNAVALTFLMSATVIAAKWPQFHISDNPNGANLVLALAIAFAKTACIVSIFMGVWWSSRLVKLFALGTVFWLIVFFAFTLSDYISVRAGFGTPYVDGFPGM